MPVRPVHLAVRPSLIAKDLDDCFAPAVAAVNGGIGADSYVENLRLPNSMKEKPGSVFQVQTRIRRLTMGTMFGGVFPFTWRVALCEPSSMNGYLFPFFDASRTAELYRETETPGALIPVPVSWAGYYGSGNQFSGFVTLQRWVAGQPSPYTIDSATLAGVTPGRLFRRPIPSVPGLDSGGWHITLTLNSMVGYGVPGVSPPCGRDLLFSVRFKMRHVR